MTIKLQKSTAGQEIPLGHFTDDTDGKTAETALTIANTDIKIWKNGATALVNKNSGGAVHMSGGVYYCTLDATDTDTYGPLVIFVHVAGALPVRVECEVNGQWYGFFTQNGTLLSNLYSIYGDSPIVGRFHSLLSSMPAGSAATGTLTTTVFTTNLTETTTDYYKGRIVAFLEGSNAFLVRRITAYNGTTKAITVSPALDNAPANGDDFVILNGLADGAHLVDDAITAPKIAADAFTAAKFAADVTTELQAGLATAAALATVSGLVDDLETRLSAVRAGYLDNLSGGAVATAAALATVNAYVDELESRLTAARAGYLDSLNSGAPLSAAAVDAILDEAVEGSLTLRQAQRLMLAALAGIANGGGTTTVNFRDMANSKNRITMTTDANGNRTAVTRDAT